MTWLALLLVGLAVCDLTHTHRGPRLLPEISGAAVVLLLGLAAGPAGTVETVATVLVAAGVVVWGRSVTWGFGTGRAWVPLTLLGALVVAALAASSWGTTVGGPLGQWWQGLDWPTAGTDPTRALLVLGAGLFQLSSGNVVVRLVLQASGTTAPRLPAGEATGPTTGPVPGPATGASGDGDDVALKGGRLLGPMERLLIFGLGLTGNLVAASIVVAAKGLLRFPELQSRRDQAQIHRITEYFLVGSFISWLVALGAVALVGG